MSTQPPYDAVLRDWHRLTEETMRLQSENARLQAENDSLRKELAVNNPLFETLNAANDRLIYENMKLRELVRDFYPFASGRAANPWLSVRLERMRELGVEV